MFGSRSGERRLDKWGATRLVHLGCCFVLLWLMLAFAWKNHPARGMVQAMRARQAAGGVTKVEPLAAGLFSGLKNKQQREQQQQQTMQQHEQWDLNQKQMSPQQKQRSLEQQQWQEQRQLQNQQWQEQRQVQQQAWQTQQEQIRRQKQQAREREGLSANLGLGLTAIVTKIWPYVRTDLVMGLIIWAAFTFGTGVYAKQLEIWLRLHQSGDAAKIRGLGLEGATAHENEGRRRPVL